MMPLKASDRKDFYQKVPLQGWKGDECRHMKFLTNGRDFHTEYGLVYIYDVEYEDEKRSLWVRPDGPLAYGLMAMLTPENDTLEGRTFEICKITGDKRSDTRYKATEI